MVRIEWCSSSLTTNRLLAPALEAMFIFPSSHHIVFSYAALMMSKQFEMSILSYCYEEIFKFSSLFTLLPINFFIYYFVGEASCTAADVNFELFGQRSTNKKRKNIISNSFQEAIFWLELLISKFKPSKEGSLNNLRDIAVPMRMSD